MKDLEEEEEEEEEGNKRGKKEYLWVLNNMNINIITLALECFRPVAVSSCMPSENSDKLTLTSCVWPLEQL